MINEIQTFFNDDINRDKIIWLLIGAVIGSTATFLVKDIFLVNVLKLLKLILTKMYKKIASITTSISGSIWKSVQKKNELRKYNRTIKKIEKRKIEIPPNFLFRKSREKNPELKTIYKMMDEGTIETPDSEILHQKLKDIDFQAIIDKSQHQTTQLHNLSVKSLNEITKNLKR